MGIDQPISISTKPCTSSPIDSFSQRKLHTCCSSNSSLAQIESAGGIKTKVTSTLVLVLSPTTPWARSIIPLRSLQLHCPLNLNIPHPILHLSHLLVRTTTRSSSPSSDVVSSQSLTFNSLLHHLNPQFPLPRLQRKRHQPHHPQIPTIHYTTQ